jgi:hypothetical protein
VSNASEAHIATAEKPISVARPMFTSLARGIRAISWLRTSAPGR